MIALWIVGVLFAFGRWPERKGLRARHHFVRAEPACDAGDADRPTNRYYRCQPVEPRVASVAIDGGELRRDVSFAVSSGLLIYAAFADRPEGGSST